MQPQGDQPESQAGGCLGVGFGVAMIVKVLTTYFPAAHEFLMGSFDRWVNSDHPATRDLVVVTVCSVAVVLFVIAMFIDMIWVVVRWFRRR